MIYSFLFFVSFIFDEKKKIFVKVSFWLGFLVVVFVCYFKYVFYWGEYFDVIVWSLNILVIILGIVLVYMEKWLLRK